MKKIVLSLVFLAATLTASAQFEKGTKYVSARLSGLDMSYSDQQNFQLGIEAVGGYYLWDNVMATGEIGYKHTEQTDFFNIGIGARYSFVQNGVYLGAGVNYEHQNPNFNNLYITPEVGYTFYVNHYVAIEPALYYKMSLNDFAHGSRVGLKIGASVYF